MKDGGVPSLTRDELVALLVRMGDEHSDDVEGLRALDHGLQCAFELERTRPGDLGLQLAGLVHDVGAGFGAPDEHGRIGAACVRRALGDRVAVLVEAHVPAKRFLVSTDPSYRDRLSSSSVHTLALQGGSLDAAGPAVVNGMVFVNSGYGQWGGMPGNVLLAFSIK